MNHLRLLPLFGLFAILSSTACATHTDDQDDTDSESEDFTAGSPSKIDIGFNMGTGDELSYYRDFFGDEPSPVGKTLCHTYTSFRVGYDGVPDPSEISDSASTNGSRARLEYILQRAQSAGCTEQLISFQSESDRAAPSEAEFKAAMEKFFTIDWKAITGFTGSIVLTAWNEPNNPKPDGNGLGVIIHPDLAARYYLTLAQLCVNHDCEVAAGDLASNGSMFNDFEINCANDNVEDLCKDKSSHAASGATASYLDVYKNTIALKSKDYGQPDRPKYFSFHGWHDINNYLNFGDYCTSYDDCLTRRLLTSMEGSWGGVELWDTETGVDQSKDVQISNPEQACGAAFVLRTHAISNRIKRIYYTRLNGGAGQLVLGLASGEGPHTPRPALDVLKNRQTSYPAGNCK